MYIKYDNYGFGKCSEECIDIDDIRYPDENNCVDDDYETDNWDGYWFIGGYCKKLKDKSIVITFGKDAKNAIDLFK